MQKRPQTTNSHKQKEPKNKTLSYALFNAFLTPAILEFSVSNF